MPTSFLFGLCPSVMDDYATSLSSLTWLDLAKMTLKASLKEQMPTEASQEDLSLQEQQGEDLLGKVLTLRAFLHSFQEDGQVALTLDEQALALLSPENTAFRAIVAFVNSRACLYFFS